MKLDARPRARRDPLPPVVDGDKDTQGPDPDHRWSRDVPGAALLTAIAAMRAGRASYASRPGEASRSPGMAMPEAMVIGAARGQRRRFRPARSSRSPSRRPRPMRSSRGPACEQGEAAAHRRGCWRCEARLALDAALASRARTGPARRRLADPASRTPASSPLLDCGEERIERDPLAGGRRAAQLYRAIVLVKGVTSHVVTPDGDAGSMKAARRALAFRAAATCLRGSSAACSRAARNR